MDKDEKKSEKRHILPWKGGREDRIYARIKTSVKIKLLKRVRRGGYKSLADWLEAQALMEPQEPKVVVRAGRL